MDHIKQPVDKNLNMITVLKYVKKIGAIVIISQ